MAGKIVHRDTEGGQAGLLQNDSNAPAIHRADENWFLANTL